MEHIFLKTKTFLLAFSIGLMLLATSCINEDLEPCYQLKLKVLNAWNEEITGGGAVEEAKLYLFDENGKYLQTIRMSKDDITSRREITLPEIDRSKVTIVAWGNSAGDGQIVKEGQSLDDFKIALKSQNALASSPDNLYYGMLNVPLKNGLLTKNEEVVIQIKISSVQMRTEGLPNHLNKLRSENILRSDEMAECQFAMDKTLSVYNAAGKLEGDSVFYEPDGTWERFPEEWATPDRYNMFSGEKMTPSLNVNGTIFGSTDAKLEVDKDIYEDVNEITIPEGRDMQIVFRFNEDGAFLGLWLRVRPWGFVDDDIEW